MFVTRNLIQTIGIGFNKYINVRCCMLIEFNSSWCDLRNWDSVWRSCQNWILFLLFKQKQKTSVLHVFLERTVQSVDDFIVFYIWFCILLNEITKASRNLWIIYFGRDSVKSSHYSIFVISIKIRTQMPTNAFKPHTCLFEFHTRSSLFIFAFVWVMNWVMQSFVLYPYTQWGSCQACI